MNTFSKLIENSGNQSSGNSDRKVRVARHSIPKMSASRNLEKESSPPGDEALDNVNKHIKEVFDILTNETNKVRKEKNAFDEGAKKLEHVHFPGMVKLNVGGHLFSTSLETLTKDPGMS